MKNSSRLTTPSRFVPHIMSGTLARQANETIP
jgi:hypothetical protein